jgi:hypothetical protein
MRAWLNVWLLSCVQRLADQCIPELPAEQRDDYIRRVSVTEGLAALAAAVGRNSQNMVLVCSHGKVWKDVIIQRLARLHRYILWQLSIADDWKLSLDAARALEKAKGVLVPMRCRASSVTPPTQTYCSCLRFALRLCPLHDLILLQLVMVWRGGVASAEQGHGTWLEASIWSFSRMCVGVYKS